ncbi:MAG: FKBP-type peptidyl-prolyl cis-trans isomerase [Paludibacter sp.]
MKKTVLILAAAVFVFASVSAKEKKSKKDKNAPAPVCCVKVFTNDVDSMSYALGMNVGADFSKNLKAIPGGKSNIDLLIKGFATAMKGDSTLMKPEVATEYFRNYMSKAQKAETEAKKADGEKFLAANSTAPGVVVTPSGLQYKIITPAEGPKPSAKDTVKVHYTGTLLDGKVFDSSVERGEPIEFPLGQVIPGWTEGVQLMSVGSKYKFFVPYNLGYGEQGTQGGPIPGFATLTFEVELLGIKTFKEPAPEVAPIEVKPAAVKKAVKPAAKPVAKKK